jgi:hypothetical protein
MATYFDVYGNVTKPKSASLILPLLLALLASGGANYWLWKERVKLTADTNAASVKLAVAEGAQKELSEKVEKLEGERASLVEAKEQAVKDAQAKVLELAKLKAEGAGAEGAGGGGGGGGAPPRGRWQRRNKRKREPGRSRRPRPAARPSPKRRPNGARRRRPRRRRRRKQGRRRRRPAQRASPGRTTAPPRLPSTASSEREL